MNIRKILFIDDGDVSAVTSKIVHNLARRSIKSETVIINLSDYKYWTDDPNNPSKKVVNFLALKEELKRDHFSIAYSAVACDYYCAGDKVDGFKILKWIKNTSNSEKKRIRRAKFVLYSSESEKFFEKTNSIEELSKLIELRLDGFLKREHLSDKLAEIISKADIKFDFGKKILVELEKYSSFKFNNLNPRLEGKSLIEVADEIEKENPNGVIFQEILIELTIAHLIDLGKE